MLERLKEMPRRVIREGVPGRWVGSVPGIRRQEGKITGEPLREFRDFLEGADHSIKLFCFDTTFLEDPRVKVIIRRAGRSGKNVQIAVHSGCEQATLKPYTKFEGVEVSVSPYDGEFSFGVADTFSTQACYYLGGDIVRQDLIHWNPVVAFFYHAEFGQALKDAAPLQVAN